jgi:hypothetical protein
LLILLTEDAKKAAPNNKKLPRCVRQNRIRAFLGCEADRVGMPPEEQCDRFKMDANKVKKLWAELTENEKADAK